MVSIEQFEYQIELVQENSHRGSGTAVTLVVAGALGLVESRLGGRLALVRLSTTGKAVTGVGEGLLDLLLGGLGGVRSQFLLGLCAYRG
jgi:hypothetical protein